MASILQRVTFPGPSTNFKKLYMNVLGETHQRGGNIELNGREYKVGLVLQDILTNTYYHFDPIKGRVGKLLCKATDGFVKSTVTALERELPPIPVTPSAPKFKKKTSEMIGVPTGLKLPPPLVKKTLPTSEQYYHPQPRSFSPSQYRTLLLKRSSKYEPHIYDDAPPSQSAMRK